MPSDPFTLAAARKAPFAPSDSAAPAPLIARRSQPQDTRILPPPTVFDSIPSAKRDWLARNSPSRIPTTLDRPPSLRPTELLVMGSGDSAALPDIACVTSPETGCACCLSTLGKAGRKNKRGNTGAVLRVPQADGSERTILIDCGKTFRVQAIALFPKEGLRKIDAVILTHQHADAIDGLDDLRAWTLNDAVESSIPIYCTKTVYDQIAIGFSYLVEKSAASGGGCLPDLNWRILDENKDLWIHGLRITPIPVNHGHYLTSPPTPLISLGFLNNSSVLYLSDVRSVLCLPSLPN